MTLLPYVQGAEKLSEKGHRDMLIEPSGDSLLKRVIELWMGSRFLEIFRSAKLAEYAARITHLEGSTQELNHITQQLTLQYFKQVHALSDKSIREITAAKVLLKK